VFDTRCAKQPYRGVKSRICTGQFIRGKVCVTSCMGNNTENGRGHQDVATGLKATTTNVV
jgi:hypothetical protein